MNGLPWKKLTAFTCIWALAFGLAGVLYVAYMYYYGSHVTDLPWVLDYARAMIRPNDFNGGIPWTQQRVDEYVQPYVERFWTDVPVSARPGLISAGVVLLGGWGFIGFTGGLSRGSTPP